MVREHQASLIASFHDWFDQRELGAPLWLAFDRWVRDALHQFAGARRVRCFHTADDGRRLVSLTTQLDEPLWPPGGLPGLIAHVLASGQAYVRNGRGLGESVPHLADEWAATIADTPGLKSSVPQWLMPIRAQGQTIGLVLVGEWTADTATDEGTLAGLGALLALCWRHVAQAEALSLAQCTDHSSGVLNWMEFCTRAQSVLDESLREGEPVVVLTLALEGMRRLDDHGHWALRDTLMRQTGGQMRAKLRSDDMVGRFSEDRFVAVLRRLDLALGEMIARKLLCTVQEMLNAQPVLAELITARCGLSDANVEGVQAAVARAIEGLRVARLQQRDEPVVMKAREVARESRHPETGQRHGACAARLGDA